MKILKLIFSFSILFFACNDDPEVLGGNVEVKTESGLSFLALGDSYTIGQNVTVDQRWPMLLIKDLKQTGRQLTTPDIVATTGWTSENLLDFLNTNPPSKKYDLVSLMIGVNNQYQGQSVELYRNEFQKLLLKSIEYANGKKEKVFVLSIPDWGVTPAARGFDKNKVAMEINQYNEVAKKECSKQNILFIDITPLSRLAIDDASMMASDGLHFSGKMHQLWVDKVMTVMTKMI